MAKYYTFDGFSNGLAQNAFAGNNLKCARGIKSVLEQNKKIIKGKKSSVRWVSFPFVIYNKIILF